MVSKDLEHDAFITILRDKSDAKRDRKLEELHLNVIKEKNKLKEQLLLVKENDYAFITGPNELKQQVEDLKVEITLLHAQEQTFREDFEAERKDRTEANDKLYKAQMENNELKTTLTNLKRSNSGADKVNVSGREGLKSSETERILKDRIAVLEHDRAELRDLRKYQKERELEIAELQKQIEEQKQVHRNRLKLYTQSGQPGNSWHVDSNLSQLSVARGSMPLRQGNYIPPISPSQSLFNPAHIGDSYRSVGTFPRSYSYHGFSGMPVKVREHQVWNEHGRSQDGFQQFSTTGSFNPSCSWRRGAGNGGAILSSASGNTLENPDSNQIMLYDDEKVCHPSNRRNSTHQPIAVSTGSYELPQRPLSAHSIIVPPRQVPELDSTSPDVFDGIPTNEPFIPDDWRLEQTENICNAPPNISTNDLFPGELQESKQQFEGLSIAKATAPDKPPRPKQRSPEGTAKFKSVVPCRPKKPSVPRKLPDLPPSNNSVANTRSDKKSPKPKPRTTKPIAKQRQFKPEHPVVQSYPPPLVPRRAQVEDGDEYNPLKRSLPKNVLLQGLDEDIRMQNKLLVERRLKNPTDEHIPVDPNLTCPVCKREFRKNQTQNCRAHVKNCMGEREQRQNDWVASMSGDTETFSCSSSPQKNL